MAHHCAQLVYEVAESAITEQNKSLFMNAPNPRKWLPTVKTTVFGTNSNWPPLVDSGGKQIW